MDKSKNKQFLGIFGIGGRGGKGFNSMHSMDTMEKSTWDKVLDFVEGKTEYIEGITEDELDEEDED